MSNVTRAALVDAARDLNEVLKLADAETGEVGIDVKLGASELRSLVAEAGQMLTPSDKIKDETRAVIKALEGGADAEEETKTSAKAKDGTAPRSDKKVKFVPVDRDSRYGAILACALSGSATVAEVARDVDVKKEDVLSSLKAGRANTGIDFAVGEDGALSITLPEGVTAETVWAAPKVKAAAKAKTEKVVPKTKKAPKAARASNGTGTKSRFNDADVIKLLVKENPKKKGSASYDRFALYREGMTCAAFLKAGGLRADLSWDRGHDFIEIYSSGAE